MYIKVKDLPECVQRALKSSQYHRKDIRVNIENKSELGGCAGDGTRSFSILVNLETGQYEKTVGSWGGANPFESKPIDRNLEPMELPEGFVLINGSEGNKTWATLSVNPANVPLLSLPPTEEISLIEAKALYCFCCLKGGSPRKEYLKRLGVDETTISDLVTKKFLKQNKRGFCQVTTEGRNAFLSNKHGQNFYR